MCSSVHARTTHGVRDRQTQSSRTRTGRRVCVHIHTHTLARANNSIWPQKYFQSSGSGCAAHECVCVCLGGADSRSFSASKASKHAEFRRGKCAPRRPLPRALFCGMNIKFYGWLGREEVDDGVERSQRMCNLPSRSLHTHTSYSLSL